MKVKSFPENNASSATARLRNRRKRSAVISTLQSPMRTKRSRSPGNVRPLNTAPLSKFVRWRTSVRSNNERQNILRANLPVRRPNSRHELSSIRLCTLQVRLVWPGRIILIVAQLDPERICSVVAKIETTERTPQESVRRKLATDLLNLESLHRKSWIVN